MKRQELIEELNKYSYGCGSCLRFRALDGSDSSVEVYIRDTFIENGIITINDKFYEDVGRLINLHVDGKINWNNSGMIFSVWKSGKSQLEGE